jgi:hypothetical protein
MEAPTAQNRKMIVIRQGNKRMEHPLHILIIIIDYFKGF